jgi:hypothetical protein
MKITQLIRCLQDQYKGMGDVEVYITQNDAGDSDNHVASICNVEYRLQFPIIQDGGSVKKENCVFLSYITDIDNNGNLINE